MAENLIAVTYDFWNTIAREAAPALEPIRSERIMATLSRNGYDVSRDECRELLRGAWLRYRSAWRSGVPFSATMAADHLCQSKGILDCSISLAIAKDLGFMFGADNLDLCPGIAETLAELAEIGVRVGLISDTGFTPGRVMRERLAELNLLGYFSGTSFSDEVGSYKPDRRIFEHALTYLDCPANSVLHVGDLHRNDVVGALNAGFRAVRYTGAYDDPEAGSIGGVLSRHRDIVQLVLLQ